MSQLGNKKHDFLQKHKMTVIKNNSTDVAIHYNVDKKYQKTN